MDIVKNYLSVNPFSRPGHQIVEVRTIDIHWTGNPVNSALDWKTSFDRLKNTQNRYASYNYIIDQSGQIIQLMPEEEKSNSCGSTRGYTIYHDHIYGLNLNPNYYSIAVGICNINWEGEFSSESWKSAIELCRYLCRKYKLTVDRILTHQMIVGWKKCPKWFVDHPDDFELFRFEVRP